MVFPYHPTRFVWTYTYGDWLKYPREADQIYQVWSLGSHRVLQWGDPEFVRRFAETTTFQDAVGFEICAPLAQKGYGNAPGAWRIFRDREREYFRWEFERYWSFFGLLGRLTYNPRSGDEFWIRELESRFQALANQALRGNSEQFLALANEKLATSRTEAAAELSERKQAIEAMLRPLSETLEKLNLRNNSDLTRFAIRRGLIDKY